MFCFFTLFFMRRKNGLFLGYILGRWTFLSSFSLIGLFLGVQIWPHSHLPVTNIPEYPSWVPPLGWDLQRGPGDDCTLGDWNENVSKHETCVPFYLRYQIFLYRFPGSQKHAMTLEFKHCPGGKNNCLAFRTLKVKVPAISRVGAWGGGDLHWLVHYIQRSV